MEDSLVNRKLFKILTHVSVGQGSSMSIMI